MTNFDTIVLGLGGMGSAAVCELARRGQRVLGLEQFPLVHDRGSSHGHTRIIRTAYYEHPSYVPLCRRSFDLWRTLERETGRHLLENHPCLSIGRKDRELITGVQDAARIHNLPIETLGSAEIQRRFPAFRVGEEFVGVLETQSGYLFVEECVQALLDRARQLGAVLESGQTVVRWSADDRGVEVETETGRYRADRLIVSAGAWATELVKDLGVPLTVMRQIMHWFPSTAAFPFPIFMLDTDDGAYYGLPATAGRGFKIARHYGAPELNHPREVDWATHETDVAPVRAFVRRYLPSLDGVVTSQVCMYTLTPDRHFVIDRHPRHERVAVAAGFSGHGFKFAPVVGEVLADFTMGRTPAFDMSLFRANRFA